jgi:ABC-2 type transport system permease protein
MFLGLLSVASVVVVGAASGIHIQTETLLLSALLAWVGAFVFAAFGLFMGYLLPSENVMQIIGPVLAVFAFFGGLFVPVALLPSAIQDFAPYMPTYGVAQIARYPLLGGNFDWTWIFGAVIWTLVFAAGAAVLFRRDTRRA